MFSTLGFMPHGHCYLWNPALLWTHAASDTIIGLAYFAISLTLYVLIKRIRIQFSVIVLSFGIFIGACGLTHFFDVWTLWHPDYWWSAVVKVVTAIASVGTGVYLFRLRHPIVKVTAAAKLSEQRRIDLETLLLRHVQAFKETFDLAPIGIAHVSPDGRWIEINRALCEITGYSEVELRARNFADITHPDDIQRDWDFANQLLRGELNRYSTEKRYIRKDGRIIWANLTVALKRTENEEPDYFISCIEDITARKRDEESLKASQASMQAFANLLPQLAWIADSEGMIYWYNRRWYEYTGTTLEQMKGRGWVKVHHTDHVTRVVREFESAVKKGEFWEDTFPLRSSQGEWRWFLSRATPIHDDSGKVICWFGTNTDISDQRRALEERDQAVHARDEFISIASHELKTPITSMKLQVQMISRMLESGYVSDARLFTKASGSLTGQLDRLTGLIEGMLDLSKINAGTFEVQLTDIDVSEVISKVVDHAKRGLPAEQIRLTLPAGRLEAHWDPRRIEQLLAGLISNAIKYGEDKPFEILIADQGKWIEIEIRDHGIGISGDQQDRIFNQFVRAIDSSNISGFGIGLTLIKAIVQAHHGTIQVQSALGDGAQFTIKIPKRPELAAQAESAA